MGRGYHLHTYGRGLALPLHVHRFVLSQDRWIVYVLRMTVEIVLEAFRMGVLRQNQQPPALVHSDRGSQYARQDFRELLSRYKCKQSMSRKGNCWDNAVAESFFGALKTELVHQHKFKTREQARLSIFDYIETFYLSPVEFEQTMGVT
jgi:putative transposase